MFKTAAVPDIMCRTGSGNKIYWMLTSEIGAPNFEMRMIEIPEGGKSSKGSHPHEHEVYVVKGSGRVVGVSRGEAYDEPLAPGDSVFIPGNEEHQWINAGSGDFSFICVVPKGAEAESKPPC